MADLFQNPEFDITFLNVTNEDKYYECCKEPYPSVTFFFKLQRKPTLYHYIISMPALVAIISSLVTFWFPIRSNIRFILNGISLLTLTLLLIHLGTELGFSSLNVPLAGQLSITTYNFSVFMHSFPNNSPFPEFDNTLHWNHSNLVHNWL